jgi:hypothetical protein
MTEGSGWSLETLLARAAIHDALMRYCWGIDRGDLALVLSAFHDGARDNHSGVEESAVERFTRTVVQAAAMRTSHNLGNILIQVDGDKAGAQSYFTAWHQFAIDGQTWDWVIAGRYVDKFECRAGKWAIVHRTVVYDFERWDAAREKPNGHSATTFLDAVVRGERGRGDYSFAVLQP